jgi:hypothetical protein
VPSFRLHHRHGGDECRVAFAAWRGFDSPLRGSRPTSSCAWGGHEIWWDLEAADEAEALGHLPPYVADRTVAVRVGRVAIP